MQAALLLATLFFGAPVIPHLVADIPAADDQDEDSAISALAAEFIRHGAQVLASSDREAFRERLDLAILAFDIRPWLAALDHADALDHTELRALADPPTRRDAVQTLVDVVGPAWQSELRAGLKEAFELFVPTHDLSPRIDLRAFTRDVSPGIDLRTIDLAATFGDRARPSATRKGLLEYLRGLLGAVVLASAADRGEVLPDWMSAAVIPRWRSAIRQLHATLDGAADHLSLAQQATADLGPTAQVLLDYQCTDGPTLAPCFLRDPGLAGFLAEIHHNLSIHFPDDRTDRLTLAPSWDHDDPESPPGLDITLYTRLDPASARAALARFDREWWLIHCSRPQTRVTIDTHLV